jgi:fumarate hydratase subunit beta
VSWSDLIPHYRLAKLRVEELGPATVGIDAHGTSIYDQLQDQAKRRLPAIMAALDKERAQR